jgi:hypothetical protein
MSPPAMGPESEVPARHPEPAPTTTATVDTTKHNGHEPNSLRAALESAGGSLKSLTVLAPQNDPFRVDTDAGHRDGAWLANTLARLGITDQRHLRGLHYVLIGLPKPNGEPYTNTDRDWQWLGMVAKAARWLRYVPFDRIVDQRNEEPEITLWSPSLSDPRSYVSVNFNVNFDVVSLPDADDLLPSVGISGFAADQPYHLVLVGEKSSLRPALGRIAGHYEADLYLPTGEISDTQAYLMARNAADDGRPMVVFYFSDCDPSGWQMPVSLFRKLQALQAMEFSGMEFEIHPVCLTPDQVREHGLPSTPLKDTERRADKWMAAMGVQQTEIDSLQPDVLQRIASDAIAPFYDDTLDRRVRQAIRDWKEQAQRVVDEQSADHREQIHADVMPALEEKRDEIQRVLDEIPELLDTVRIDAGMFDLPPIPEVPEPVIDHDRHPEPLCDSRWNFTEQCRRLIAWKNYDTNGHYDDGYIG